MNVVTRGLMAAGMAIYAAIHGLQVAGPPEGAPAWLTVAFGAATVLGATSAVLLILAPERLEGPAMLGAAALAAASLLALLAAYTVGFFGVQEEALRAETGIVAVAELIVIAAFVAERRTEQVAGSEVREQ